jgi:hypothetical protein
VAQRVEADAAEARAFGGRCQDAAAQAALVGRAAVAAREDEAVAGMAGLVRAEFGGHLGVERDRRAPWRDLGATTEPFTIARRTRRCGVASSRAKSLQRSPAASEIRSPVAATPSDESREWGGGRHRFSHAPSSQSAHLDNQRREAVGECLWPEAFTPA